MKNALQRVWYRAAPPPLMLRPLAWLYGQIADARARRQRLRARRLPVPVIVVGNIAVGGTGKTPCVLWLVEQLQAMGRRPGVISRGYKGRGPFPHLVRADDDAAVCGDEPLLLALRSGAPVVVAPDRWAAGMALLNAAPETDVIVCDDGLQHYALARDIEVGVVDGLRGHGNGWRLPAGPLREPPARLRLADLVFVNGASPIRYGPNAVRFDLAIDVVTALQGREQRPLSAFGGRSVRALAGIGHPQRFFAALRDAGLDVDGEARPDHHVFTADDFESAGARPTFITEKDAVKCLHLAPRHVWIVPATTVVHEPAATRVRHYLHDALAKSVASRA